MSELRILALIYIYPPLFMEGRGVGMIKVKAVNSKGHKQRDKTQHQNKTNLIWNNMCFCPTRALKSPPLGVLHYYNVDIYRSVQNAFIYN